MPEPPFSRLLSAIPFKPVLPAIEKWLTHEFSRLYSTVQDGENPCLTALKRLNIEYDCPAEELRLIPESGPVIVVANHPFGFADAAVIGALISEVRPDVRILTNSLLGSVPELQGHIIAVDNIGGSDSSRANMGPLRRCLEWLGSGGVLAIFPAGEVASLQLPQWGIRDPQWTANVVRLAKRSGAVVIPAYFHGGNSVAFHLAGLVHPQLRTMMLPHEFIRKAGTRIAVSIGSPIPAERLAQAPGFREATEYVRARTHLLRYRKTAAPRIWLKKFPVKQHAVSTAIDAGEMECEIAGLPASQCLHEQGENQVFVARARRIPAVMHEIGRLRELTFRACGEGTGTPLDLDSFDAHYEHLFIWNREKREIAGAYRLAGTDQVIKNHGVDGLYTSTLFRLHREFYGSIGPALELGRSFVRTDYQKSYVALLLLWKGLGHYVAQNPQYRILFGPVSISREYSESSRGLMVSYLRERHGNAQLSRMVQPGKKYKVRGAGECDPRNVSSLLCSLDELSDVIADIEPDGKRLPVLLRHYLNLGGQILDFSVDRKFSSVLDGLIVVDLTRTGRKSLERYMGKENALKYLERHEGNSWRSDTALTA